MCGLFGVIGTNSISALDTKFLATCCIAGAVRGVHSTGLCFLNKKGESSYLKKAVNGTTFVTDVFDPVKQMYPDIKAVIGHNRAATVGSVSDETAHPFHEGNVLGVHNGTLNKGWANLLEVSSKIPVDSQGLYRAISSRGIDWAVEHLNGAAALIWTDLRSGRTYVYRNEGRKLHWVMGTNNRMYYASESGMLSWAMERNGICRKGEMNKFDPNTLYEITDGIVTKLRTLKQYRPPITYTKQTKQTALPPVKATAKQKGVSYRGLDVSQAELESGIIGEWAETVNIHYECVCCGKPIKERAFIEDVSDSDIRMHEGCRDFYVKEIDQSPSHIIIVRDTTLPPISLEEDKRALLDVVMPNKKVATA